MKSHAVQCPGKVFILGEYSCIQGGSALLQTIEPGFELAVDAQSAAGALSFQSFLEKVHPQSTAGKLLRENENYFRNKNFSWKEPYRFQTGIGSSSAQFLLLFEVLEGLEDGKKRDLAFTENCLKEYWRFSENPAALLPSGADLLAQALGGPCVVQTTPKLAYKKLNSFAPSTDAKLLLVFTGQKKKTHSVLEELKAKGFPEGFDLVNLEALTLQGISAWSSGDATVLGKTFHGYQKELEKLQISSNPNFSDLVESINSFNGVLGCKGAGAQGGDCILVLVQNKAMPLLQNHFQKTGLSILTEL